MMLFSSRQVSNLCPKKLELKAWLWCECELLNHYHYSNFSGQCTWGSSCRFVHPGVLDKGNYSMFAPPRPILPGGAADLPEIKTGTTSPTSAVPAGTDIIRFRKLTIFFLSLFVVLDCQSRASAVLSCTIQIYWQHQNFLFKNFGIQ